jgi:ElaB/YqjD/DUF883 family membrane-anchored ribosome-binding protein
MPNEINAPHWPSNQWGHMQNECNLIQFAKMVGTAAGYLERSRRGNLLADAGRLLQRSPDRSMMAAAAVGLLLGTLLRRW